MTALALVALLVFGAVAGLEVIWPLAIVLLGGLITSTLVTLLLLPGLYLWVTVPRAATPSPVAPTCCWSS